MYMYPDSYEFYGQGLDEVVGGVVGFAAIFLLIWLGIAFLTFVWRIVMYVLHSLGMYTIAQRRGIHRPWLSWVPVANAWILGSISDQYQYVSKGNVRSRRKLLLGLEIARCAAMTVLYICNFSLIIGMVSGAVSGETIALGMGGVSLLITALAILVMVFQYIAYYDLFHSCNPGQSTVFLVLSILFNFLLPIFVFCCRKKDLGMPPRKSRAAAPGYQPAPQPVYEPVYQPEVVAPEAAAQPEVTTPEVVEAQDTDFEE